MNKDDIRLNKAKRDAIKKAWRDTTLKTPTQKDTLLQDAVDTFRELEQSVWDNVINPVVTQNFPQDDMKILKKYSRGGYGAVLHNTIIVFTLNLVLKIDKKRSIVGIITATI
jgi:hypothetical protein